MYLLYRSDSGVAVSYGSVLADPMPEGLTVRLMTDEETAGVFGGWLMWDADSLTFVQNPNWTPLVEPNP